jgi:two-component system sensor histidine kinase BaeS
LEGAVAAHRPEAETRRVVLVLVADKDLPLVDVDPDRAAQVVNNLLQNALRFTPQGGRIVLSARLQDGTVEFSVQDGGPGIPADDLPRVFDRFYKGDKARQRAEGRSGLGLSIARGLVRAHGGSIWAESPVGQGATFRFTLPAA